MLLKRLSWKDVLYSHDDNKVNNIEEMHMLALKLGYLFFSWGGKVYIATTLTYEKTYFKVEEVQ